MYLKRILVIFVFSFICFHLPAQQITLKINLRGVYESKITLMPLVGANALKPVIEQQGVKNGTVATLIVPAGELPGEFVVRFDYKDKITATPYPSEKHLFISNQNIELWVNPPFCNNNDSTRFQKDEKENALYNQFILENGKQKAQITLLQNFLMNYDDPRSKLYQQGITEYEKRRNQYNQWLSSKATLNNALFVSHTFQFQHVPELAFKGSEADKMQSVLKHYFDGIDFTDTLVLRTTNLKEWMNGYVNIYGAMSKTEALRDSLFALAGKNAIEKARTGNPKVYGWMVDYFYAGYESYGIKKGMAMLQPYIDDPDCLTSKKQQIIKRLESMTRLVAGTMAPDFSMNNIDGTIFNFHAFKEKTKYKLLLFWSADCSHCQQLVSELSPWYNETGNREKLDIVAVNVDETAAEVKKWESAITDLKGWNHLRAKGGINASVANDYAILSTPVMFLVESETNIIKAIPDNLEQLIKYIKD